ncbi:MAG: DnaJ domain-containing protein [Spirochaetes bacterium]|nr:DnaJ domain-containing protein [Spirochaetota bacterium]
MFNRLAESINKTAFPCSEFIIKKFHDGTFTYKKIMGYSADNNHSFPVSCGFAHVKSACMRKRNLSFYIPAAVFTVSGLMVLFLLRHVSLLFEIIPFILLLFLSAAAGKIRKNNYRIYLDYDREAASSAVSASDFTGNSVWLSKILPIEKLSSDLPDRNPAFFTNKKHDFVLSHNNPPVSVHDDNDSVYFFPDFIIHETHHRTRMYSYQGIRIGYYETVVPEKYFAVKNVLTVGSSFLHVTKTGKPDRRYLINPEINENVYAFVKISHHDKVLSEIVFADIKAGYHFAQVMAKKCYVYSEKRHADYFHRRNIRETYSSHERAKWEKEREKRRSRKSFYSDRSAVSESLHDTDVREAFSILGVDENVSSAEIKKAYRTLVKKHHPDVAKNKNDEYVKKIIEAYEILSGGR